MKQVFEEYASYNVWANQRITDCIIQLPEDIVTKTVKSSFSSLKLTLLHIWNSQSTWWQRLELVENVVPEGNESFSVQKIAAGLILQSVQFQSWVEKSTIADLENELVYQNSKKQQFKQPVYQVLLHLFNHNTYHRGQLVTMLRELDVTTIPATDFILFARGK